MHIQRLVGREEIEEDLLKGDPLAAILDDVESDFEVCGFFDMVAGTHEHSHNVAECVAAAEKE